ncbi:HD domain-containing protein [Oceanithermus sp.]
MTRALGHLSPPRLPCWPTGGWLVGGAVRDLLLGLRPVDFDFATPIPRDAASSCARTTNGAVFPLDEERDHWRVAADGTTYDFAPLAGDLAANLQRRDYTANALALSARGALFGPAQAPADLRRRVLRALSRENLEADPLRPLRGWRLWVTRGLRPEPRTRRWIVELARAQRFGRRPAVERVREELERVLCHPRAAWGFTKLQELELAQAYLREWSAGAGVAQLGYHHLDVLGHELEALWQLSWRFPRASLALRWAALLHDMAKPLVRQWDETRGYYRFFDHDEDGAALAGVVLRRLRYGSARVRRVQALVRRHMRLPPESPRGLRRWLLRNRELLPDLIALQIADRAASRGPLARNETGRIQALYAAHEAARAFLAAPRPKPLLSGDEVMRMLNLEPGPLVGRALRALEEAQVVGDVRDRKAAQAFVRWWYETETAAAERPGDPGGHRPE